MSLYIFDKDGTLVHFKKSRVGLPKPATKPEEQVLKDFVFEKIEKLRAAGHAIAIASNQSDVARGSITLEQSKALLKNCAAKLGGVDAWRLSPYDPHGRRKLNGRPNPYARDDETLKPHPGMIISLMKELGYSPTQTIMVGDSKADKEAARAAGVRYIKAKDFFKKPKSS